MSRRIVILGVLLVLLLAVGWWRGGVTDGPRPGPPAPESADPTGEGLPPRSGENDSGSVLPPEAEDAEDRPELVAVEVLVVDEGGSPRAGIEVRALDKGFAHREWKRPEEMILARAETDEEGRAKLMVPADPEVRIHAFGAGLAASTTSFQAKRARSHELRLARAGTVGGRVLTHEGDPIEAATVVGFFETRAGFLSAFVTTDRDGRFDFEGVPPDDLVRDYVYLHAGKKGYWRTGDRRGSMQEAREGETVLRLHRRALLRGRCVSQDGEPVARALVRVEIRDPWREASARTGPDGRFTLFTVPGSGRGLVIGRNHAPLCLEEIRAGRLPTDLGDLVLRPGGAVRGTVTGPDGKPLPGAEVRLDFREGKYGSDRETTDAAGRFVFLHVGEGEHDLVVVGPREDVPGLQPMQLVRAEVRANDPPIEVRLTGAGYLQIRLAAADRKHSVASRSVRIEVLRDGEMEKSRGTGWAPGQAYRFRTRPGRVTIRVTVDAYEPSEVDAVVRDDAEVIVEVPMRRSGR